MSRTLRSILIANGTYFRAFPYPLVPGYDWVGKVVAVGATTRKTGPLFQFVHIGDTVAGMTSVGGMQQFVVRHADDVVVLPYELASSSAFAPASAAAPSPSHIIPTESDFPPIDAADAVSCVLNYTTAYQLLHRAAEGRIIPGASILIHSVTGGTGSAIVELAKAAGVVTIYGTCSAKNFGLARSMGVTPIDYRCACPCVRTRSQAGAHSRPAAPHRAAGRKISLPASRS